jgi:hypothetical protein
VPQPGPGALAGRSRPAIPRGSIGEHGKEDFKVTGSRRDRTGEYRFGYCEDGTSLLNTVSIGGKIARRMGSLAPRIVGHCVSDLV